MSTPEIIEDLTDRLFKAGNHHSVHMGFRKSYVTPMVWFVWLGSEPTLDFDTFDELEEWVEERIGLSEGG